MSALNIRKVQITEAEMLLELAEITFRHSFEHLNEPEHFEAYMSEAFNLDQFRLELANPESAFYFAESDHKVLAYIKLNWGAAQTDLQAEPGMELQRIYVRPENQGMKIGQYLLDQSINLALKAQFPFLWLGVWEKNPAAIRFYERHGFKKFDSHTFMVGNDPQTDLLMKLDLTTPEKN